MFNYRNSIIIYDWDDTLFPTSWVKNNFNNTTLYFQKLDKSIYTLLKESLIRARVFIVTNASLSWILYTLKYLPLSNSLINEYINIISANDLYYNKTNDSDMWKILAYNHNLLDVIRMSENVISIGDSDNEYKALISLNKLNTFYKHIYLKNIKFIKTPTFNELIDQHNILTKQFDLIFNIESHLDLNFN